MRARGLTAVVLALSVVIAACAGDRSASPPRAPTVVGTPPSKSEVSTDAPPPRVSAEAACSTDGLPPLDMVSGNVVDTELTAFGEITASKVTGTDGSEPPPASGYVHFVYEVDVVQQFTGERLEHLRLIQGAEADIKPQKPGVLLFFSACIGGNGDAFEPDVGYVFPVEPACQKQIAEMASTAAKSLPDPDARGSACRHE